MSEENNDLSVAVVYQLLKMVTDDMLKNVLSGNTEYFVQQAEDLYETALAEMGSISAQLENADEESRQTFRRIFFQMLFEGTEDSRMAVAVAMGRLSRHGCLKLEDAAKSHIELMAD